MSKSWRSKKMGFLIRWGEALAERRQWYERHPKAKFVAEFAAMFVINAFIDCLWYSRPEQTFQGHIGDITFRAVIVASAGPVFSRWQRKKPAPATVNEPGV